MLVRDSGSPVLSSTASVVIRILDENDHLPMFLLSVSEIQILENQDSSVISTILAVDMDAANNRTVQCHIIGKVQCFIMTNISKQTCSYIIYSPLFLPRIKAEIQSYFI